MDTLTLYKLMQSHSKSAICSVRFSSEFVLLLWSFTDRTYYAKLELGQMSYANKVCQRAFRDIKAEIKLYEGDKV